MVLLGGVQTLTGPSSAPLVYHGARHGHGHAQTEFWRAGSSALVDHPAGDRASRRASPASRRWPSGSSAAMERPDDALLEVEGICEGLRRRAGGRRRVSFALAAGELAGADRPERRRQDHLLQHAERPARGPTPGRSARRAAARPGLAPRAVWRLGVGRTFQITATFGSMTVRENVQMALLLAIAASCSASVGVARRDACRDEADGAARRRSAWATRPSAPAACWPMAT